MKYKITYSYNWYETETEKYIIKTYYINGVSFTFDEISKIFQEHPDIIDEANKNLTYTPEYFYLKSFYLIDKALSEAAKKRKASDKWKKSVSASLKGIMTKEKNPSWGKKWWNNGVENKFSKECPGKDFSLGRLINRE